MHAHKEPIAFSFDGEYTKEAVRLKLIRVRLLEEVVGQLKNGCSTTSCFSKLEFDLPEELPSVQERLKTWAAGVYSIEFI
jgi:hypothetical protein